MAKSSKHRAEAPSGGSERMTPQFSRRGFLGAVGGLAGGAAAGAGLEMASAGAASTAVTRRSAIEPFYGVHQGGIATAPQSHSYFAAFDVITERRSEVADLFKSWTAIAGEPDRRKAGAVGDG